MNVLACGLTTALSTPPFYVQVAVHVAAGALMTTTGFAVFLLCMNGDYRWAVSVVGWVFVLCDVCCACFYGCV